MEDRLCRNGGREILGQLQNPVRLLFLTNCVALTRNICRGPSTIRCSDFPKYIAVHERGMADRLRWKICRMLQRHGVLGWHLAKPGLTGSGGIRCGACKNKFFKTGGVIIGIVYLVNLSRPRCLAFKRLHYFGAFLFSASRVATAERVCI
ncbi:unnamed protein product [Ostreobium quekettii]|uniref:Uncharacterized protein n=1 Tax=Ostreobium quekettii TaxID=121088 RepID=A0A8S1J6I2_9CHLO|nr:unnamed protein product [Ostreobium quekettii]